MTVERLNPEGLAEPGAYTHVVVTESRRLVFVSGQVALDADGLLVGGSDVVTQARQAFANLVVALRTAGAGPEDVTKLTTFVVAYSPDSMEGIRAARREAFGDALPASTFLGVQALARPEFLIEVEAVAAID